jgi:hypothetical protein
VYLPIKHFQKLLYHQPNQGFHFDLGALLIPPKPPANKEEFPAAVLKSATVGELLAVPFAPGLPVELSVP